LPTTAKQTTWDAAYNDSIVSASVSGTTTKTLTLTQQDAGTITASWSDLAASGTVTSVGLSSATSGVSIGSSPITTSGTITLDIATATTSQNGLLSSTDWSTFNAKQNAITLTTTGTSGASTLVGATLNIPNYGSALTGYVPYTGATANVDLGTFNLTADVITGATGSFASSGGSNTFDINHSSGSGIALNITKGGNGEGLYINKTSGSGNAATIIGTLNATTLVKSGGTSSQFLKANGTVDSSAYITLTGLSATAPLSYNNTTGGFTISQAGVSGNGYLSSTDWNTFNNKQASGNYITALSGEATASGPGSAAVTLSTSAVTGKILTGVNITGGSITATDSILVAFGKVQNQINGVLGGAIYQSTWNASTNTPTLTSSTGTKGYYYIVSVEGSTNLDGITDWKVGDWAIFNGTTWDKVDNTDAVSSVNGYTGAVSLTTSDITEGSRLYYTEVRVSANTDVAANTAARHAAVTIGTANGLSLSTQALSLALASTSATGALSSTDWNTFNLKQAALSGTGFVKISGSTISYDNSTYLTTSSAASTYLPLAGGTLTGALSGTTATFSGEIESSSYIQSKLGASASIGLGSRFQWDNAATGASQKQLSLQMNAAFGLDLWYFNGSTYNNTGIKFNIDGSINGKSFVSNGALLDSDIAANKTFIDNNNGARFLSYGPNSTTRGSILFYQGSSANTLGQYALTIDASGNSVFIGTISATNFSGTSSGTNTGDQSLASLGAQAQLNGTGFVKASGTTISYDNTSYLPLAGGTLTGALNINLSSGTAMNVAGNAIFRGDTGVGTPRQLIISSGGSTPVYLEAKGYGANYQTDFGIKTYNSAGTAFEVFYADSSGRVGINRVAPSYQLDVNGTGRFEGALRVNGGTTTIYDSSEARLNFNTDVDGEQNSSWLYSDSNATLGSIGNVYIQALSTTVLSVLDFNNYGNNTANGVTGNVFIGTSVAQGIDKGAVLSLGGWTTSTGSASAFGRIAGRKENATSGNQAGYLSFETANALVSQSTEKMRITSTGKVGVNTTSPQSTFVVGVTADTQGCEIDNATSGVPRIFAFNRSGGVSLPLALQSVGGNVLIGTTTDGGGKLQVNGEIRMYGSTLFRGMSSNTLQLCGGTSSSNVKIDGSVEVVTIDTNGATRLTIGSNGFIQATNTTQTDDLGTIQIYNTTASAFANSSLTVKSYNGTGQFMQWENYGMRIGSRIKTNTGAGGIYFTYGNDSVGMTIKSTGVINFSNVPTSSSGLSSGDIYKSAGVLMIV
jgi:hypothetical protein